MSQIAPIVIKDAAATPADHTFSPVSIDASGVAKWADRFGGISVGFPVLTLSEKSPNQNSKSYKVIGKVVLPILEQTSASTATGIQPAPTVAYSLVANFEMVLPERSTRQNRKDLAAYFSGFMANVAVKSMIEDYENVY